MLDVGCGTGNQLVANRKPWPHARFAGLDPSSGMLRRARSKSPEIAWTRGDGADLPFRSSTFDFATSRFSFHHVARKQRMLHELHRVIRPRGRFVMRTIDPLKTADSPLYAYFPEAREADRRDFMQIAGIEAGLLEAGFERIDSFPTRNTFVQSRREVADRLRRRDSCSQLLTISDEAYAAGLRKLEDDLARPGGGEERLVSAIVVFRIRADRGGAQGG